MDLNFSSKMTKDIMYEDIKMNARMLLYRLSKRRHSRRDVTSRASGRLQDSQVVLCTTLPQLSSACKVDELEGGKVAPEQPTKEDGEMVGNTPGFAKLDKVILFKILFYIFHLYN